MLLASEQCFFLDNFVGMVPHADELVVAAAHVTLELARGELGGVLARVAAVVRGGEAALGAGLARLGVVLADGAGRAVALAGARLEVAEGALAAGERGREAGAEGAGGALAASAGRRVVEVAGAAIVGELALGLRGVGGRALEALEAALLSWLVAVELRLAREALRVAVAKVTAVGAGGAGAAAAAGAFSPWWAEPTSWCDVSRQCHRSRGK